MMATPVKKVIAVDTVYRVMIVLIYGCALTHGPRKLWARKENGRSMKYMEPPPGDEKPGIILSMDSMKSNVRKARIVDDRVA